MLYVSFIMTSPFRQRGVRGVWLGHSLPKDSSIVPQREMVVAMCRPTSICSPRLCLRHRGSLNFLMQKRCPAPCPFGGPHLGSAPTNVATHGNRWVEWGFELNANGIMGSYFSANGALRFYYRRYPVLSTPCRWRYTQGLNKQYQLIE